MRLISAILIALILIFFSCKKSGEPLNIPPPVIDTLKPPAKPLPTITSFSPLTGSVDTVVTITGAHFNFDISRDSVKFNGTKAIIKSATDSQLIVAVPSGATTGKITVFVDTNKVVSRQDFTVHTGNLWTLLTSFPGTPVRFLTSFQIGNKMYCGLGQVGSSSLSEFWEYDFSSGIWTQKADYPVQSQPGLGVAFTVGNKGYVIMSPDSLFLYPAMWEYNPASDLWTLKGYTPIKSPEKMVAFTLDNFAYVGPGGQSDSTQKLWRYDPATNSWTRRSDYPGMATVLMTSFTIGQYAYVGTGIRGIDVSSGSKEFYRYDPSNDTWTRKADFSGSGRSNATGFAIGNFGYLGTGQDFTGFYVNDFWRYDPSLDSWKQISFFPGGTRVWGIGFSGDNQGYFGFGLNSDYYLDIWKYQP